MKHLTNDNQHQDKAAKARQMKSEGKYIIHRSTGHKLLEHDKKQILHIYFTLKNHVFFRNLIEEKNLKEYTAILWGGSKNTVGNLIDATKAGREYMDNRNNRFSQIGKC